MTLKVQEMLPDIAPSIREAQLGTVASGVANSIISTISGRGADVGKCGSLQQLGQALESRCG